MKQILLVDDDPENRESVIGFLNINSKNINVLVATNGSQAVEIAKKKRPDLIIMDWDMPVMNGIEATKEIKKLPECKGLPIIMFTGVRTSSDNLQEALRAGAIDFLRKPVDNVELMARINSMLLLTDYFNDKITAEAKNNLLMQEKLDSEVSFKERELQALTLAIIGKNELMADIKVDLLGVLGMQDEIGQREEVNRIVRELDSNANEENYWEEFRKRFTHLHVGFIEKLQLKFPNLSGNETKLCCYLKMNMSNKEIAQLLNASLDAVDKSRYRLRKKLNIDSDVNINQFLVSL